MKTPVISLCLLLTLTISGFSQEKQDDWNTNGVFQSRENYHQFMVTLKTASASDPELRALIPMINDVVLGQSLGQTSQKYAGEQTMVDLLANADVRKELEMVDSQYEEIQQANARIQKNLAEQIRGMDFTEGNELAEQIKQLRFNANKELEAALLPHQISRLQQIAAQSRLRFQSLGQLLTSEPVKSQLEISETQKSELLQSEKEIEQELQEQIAQLRRNARNKLLATLNTKQRKKANELLGEEFQFKKSTPNKLNKK